MILQYSNFVKSFKLLLKFAKINIHRLEKGIFYYRTVRHVDEKSVYKT